MIYLGSPLVAITLPGSIYEADELASSETEVVKKKYQGQVYVRKPEFKSKFCLSL
jgi:hypothetical protein